MSQSQGSRVDILWSGLLPTTRTLGSCGLLMSRGEVIAGHYPVECWGDHTREWDLCRGDLSLELVLCSAFPGIHEGGQVVGELIITSEDEEDLSAGGVVNYLCGVEGGVFDATSLESHAQHLRTFRALRNRTSVLSYQR